jgi:hypothetical protein
MAPGKKGAAGAILTRQIVDKPLDNRPAADPPMRDHRRALRPSAFCAVLRADSPGHEDPRDQRDKGVLHPPHSGFRGTRKAGCHLQDENRWGDRRGDERQLWHAGRSVILRQARKPEQGTP